MSKTNDQEKKEYEERLRRRLKILQQQLDAGKVKIAEGLQVIESLEAVRTGSDGEVDLSTVDGLVRSMALAVTAIHDRQELKDSISLSEIQNMYFTFIENNFGHFYKTMTKRNLTPHDVGLALTQNKDSIQEILQGADGLLSYIQEFWEQLGDIAHIHVEDMNSSKSVFGGDLFPSHNENIASKSGLYTDTIVLPDPFLRSKHVFEKYSEKDKVYYLIKHAMNILKYKDLACADINPPLLVILPDVSALQQEEAEFFHKLGEEDSLIHSGKLFGRDFKSIEELFDFAGQLDTVERAVAEIADPKRVLFDTEWKGDLAAQLHQAMASKHYASLGLNSPGMILAAQSVGRMSVSNELLVKSRRLNGTPIIDAPTSWQYFAWKLEYDAAQAEHSFDTVDLHILRGLQNLGANEMVWLGKVPNAALIEIRKQGALEEIRHILGNGIAELTKINPSNFHRSSDKIFDNINQAFDEHKLRIKELEAKKWKFAGTGIGSWLAVGTLEVTAAATGIPVWGLSAIIADQLLDVPKLKDIPNSIKELAKESKDLNRSPVGMLFSYSQIKT